MSERSVREQKKKFNLDKRIIELPDSIATVALAAKELNCEESRIAKSLAFKIKDKNILIVSAGDVKIDNANYRHEFGEKAKMLSYEEVEDCIGHPVGGVCPFGVKEDVDIYLDESLKRFESVFPACGSTHNAIEIMIEELETTTNYKKWIDVCKFK